VEHQVRKNVAQKEGRKEDCGKKSRRRRRKRSCGKTYQWRGLVMRQLVLCHPDI
jgi:hypothetical protein